MWQRHLPILALPSRRVRRTSAYLAAPSTLSSPNSQPFNSPPHLTQQVIRTTHQPPNVHCQPLPAIASHCQPSCETNLSSRNPLKPSSYWANPPKTAPKCPQKNRKKINQSCAITYTAFYCFICNFQSHPVLYKR